MGLMMRPRCRACGHGWGGELLGGTMLMGVYRCTRCANTRRIDVTMLRDAGLPDSPWDLLAGKVDKLVGRCECGGRFRSDAPVRCPACNSDDVELYGGFGDIVVLNVD